MESTMRRFGNAAKNRSFTGTENRAALELRANSDDRSHRSGSAASSASIIGRPMASPAMRIELAPSASTSRHASSASNRGISTTVLPWAI